MSAKAARTGVEVDGALLEEARRAPDGVAIEGTGEAAPGVVIDLDADGDAVAIEALNVSLRGRKDTPVADKKPTAAE